MTSAISVSVTPAARAVFDGCLVDGAAAPGDDVGEGEQGGHVRVGGLGVAGALDLVAVELGDVLSQEGVGGQAVGAAVVLGGGQREAFADGGGQRPAGERAGQAHVALAMIWWDFFETDRASVVRPVH